MNVLTANYLKYKGYTDVYVIDPPQSSNYILISQSGGFGEEDGGTGFARPTLQILIGNKSYETAKSLAKSIVKDLSQTTHSDIINALFEHYTWADWTSWDKYTEWGSYVDKVTKNEVDENELIGFQLLSGPADLGRTEDLRYTISINYTAFNNIF